MQKQHYCYIKELQRTQLIFLSCLLCSLLTFYVQGSEDAGVVQVQVQGFCIGPPGGAGLWGAFQSGAAMMLAWETAPPDPHDL